MPSFMGIGFGFSVSVSLIDFSSVGASGFWRLYSSIERIAGCAGAVGTAAPDSFTVGTGAAAFWTAALMAATVGEGAKLSVFCSQQWGPTVQPSILWNSSQSYTRLALTPLRGAYFLQQDQPFDASWNTGGAVWYLQAVGPFSSGLYHL